MPLHSHVSTQTEKNRRDESYHMMDLQGRVVDKGKDKRWIAINKTVLGSPWWCAWSVGRDIFIVELQVEQETRVGELVCVDTLERGSSAEIGGLCAITKLLLAKVAHCAWNTCLFDTVAIQTQQGPTSKCSATDKNARNIRKALSLKEIMHTRRNHVFLSFKCLNLVMRYVLFPAL